MAKVKQLREKELIRYEDGQYFHFLLKKKYDTELYGIVPVGEDYVVCDKTKKKYNSKKFRIAEIDGQYFVYEHDGFLTAKEAKQFLIDTRANIAEKYNEATAQAEYDRLIKEFQLEDKPKLKVVEKEPKKKKASEKVVQFYPFEKETKLTPKKVVKKVTKKPDAKNVAKPDVKKVSKVVKNAGNK